MGWDPPPLFEPCDGSGAVLFCPAKINLALSVAAAQADGMHLIASWVVPVEFGDTLVLRRSSGPARVRLRLAEDAPRPFPIDWPLERDLAFRALRAVEARLGRELGVDAELIKRVPPGAGLGGGSADAAAVLDGVNRVLGLGLGLPDLLDLASALGADVPFQLAARHKPSGGVVTGVGDQIDPLPPSEGCPLLLVLPPFGCATAQVYSAFDKDGAGQASGPDLRRVQHLAGQPLSPAADLFNDLARPACHVQPGLGRLVDLIRAEGHRPHVTGSGAALFVLLNGRDKAQHARARDGLASATGCPVVLTATAG